ncbi:MAG TPA: hypothetical protein VFQ86_00790 [Arachidicoccus soli]|nr:hypothetical protein [Arachidicoccus soli]
MTISILTSLSTTLLRPLAYMYWGYFDYRLQNETAFQEGYQSMPVDWKISSSRKKAFFSLLKEMTQGDEK